MVQSNLAFKIISRIIYIKESKNFFVIEKNSFYAEPLLFYVKDVFVSSIELTTLKSPYNFGLYSFTTDTQMLHTPQKKVLLNDQAITYELYGIRSDNIFIISELRKKVHKTNVLESYQADTLTSQGCVNLIYEMHNIINKYSAQG